MRSEFLGRGLFFPSYVPPSANLYLGPFLTWLVQATRPRNVVTLGLDDGFGYFAVCEAVKRAGFDARCSALGFTLESGSAAISQNVQNRSLLAENLTYSNFSKIVPSGHDTVRDTIRDGTIDLLIFEKNVDAKSLQDWSAKLSRDAIILCGNTTAQNGNNDISELWSRHTQLGEVIRIAQPEGSVFLCVQPLTPDGLSEIIELCKSDVGLKAVEDFWSYQGKAFEISLRQGKDLSQAQRDLEKSNKLAADLELKIAHLKSQLTDARQRPLKSLRRKALFKLLRLLVKASPPLSPRAAQRFERSARKRDPLRDEELVVHSRGEDEVSYNLILDAWAQQRRQQKAALAQIADQLQDGPLISVIVPVYNPDLPGLTAMINSVLDQSYSNWELCLADDCSRDDVREQLSEFAKKDDRIKVAFRKENGHISRASNSAIELATGAFLALVDHDDLLDPDALLLVARAIRENSAARIIYTDEDKVNEKGVRYDPHFKPDWNRDLLYGINYISHLGVYDAKLVESVGGFRSGYEGAQDYDLLLRCIEKIEDSQIIHIPKVLYSWRATAGSVASSADAKPYASECGRRALAEHFERLNEKTITVDPGPVPFTYNVNWPIEQKPLVSIIIPTRDKLDLVRMAVTSILEKTEYPNLEILIVDNGSIEDATLQWFADIASKDSRVRVIRDERPFNYSALNNAAVAESAGEFVALLNNDIEVTDGSWLDEMVSLASRPKTGCVGAKLHFPDGSIQHAGVIVGMGGVAGHAHLYFPSDHPGYFARLLLRQNFSAVTAACMVVRRDIYIEVGGLNETDLTVAFNDVDFCMKVQAAGYHNVWTPLAELTHHESASRGHEDTPEKQSRFTSEVEYMLTTWKTESLPDPAYNPNLSLVRSDFSYAVPQWKV
ncbi:MAG: glycosyltransferase [Pseudomonadota bacterium]